MAKKKNHKEWIKEWFPVSYDHIFISYLPNKDRFEKEFNVETWETKFLKLQGSLFGGATSYPSRGSYREINTTGKIKEWFCLLLMKRILLRNH